MNIPELGKGNGEIGNGRKINKKSPGVSCTGGEGWVVEQEARRGNPGVRRQESEGSGMREERAG